MTTTDQVRDFEQDARHERLSDAVTKALAGLSARYARNPEAPFAIFEGGVFGGAVVLLSRTNTTAAEVADLLEEIAEQFRSVPADVGAVETRPN